MVRHRPWTTSTKIALVIAVVCVGAPEMGCFRLEAIEGRPCPCTVGFECCANRCVQREDTAICVADAGLEVAPFDAPGEGSNAPRNDARDAADDRPALTDAAPSELARDASDADVAPDRPFVDDSANHVGDAEDGRAVDGQVDMAGDARCSEDGASVMARVLGAGFLDIGSQPTDHIYSGRFELGPCERLVNDAAAVVYTQDQGSIPSLTAGLTILHTFDPAGPMMTSPAAQPPGKYYIDSPAMTYDALTATYAYSFHAVNFVTCPDAGACQYIDSTNYRVAIDVRP